MVLLRFFTTFNKSHSFYFTFSYIHPKHPNSYFFTCLHSIHIFYFLDLLRYFYSNFAFCYILFAIFPHFCMIFGRLNLQFARTFPIFIGFCFIPSNCSQSGIFFRSFFSVFIVHNPLGALFRAFLIFRNFLCLGLLYSLGTLFLIFLRSFRYFTCISGFFCPSAFFAFVFRFVFCVAADSFWRPKDQCSDSSVVE